MKPLEQGGPRARLGFLYQDHVAARFCIEMLTGNQISQVWCESEDDIVLIWSTGDGTLVEFVQVKSNLLGQLWSQSLLCQGGPDDSVVGKSMAHDRCEEPCCFRIVTRTGIQSSLYPLTLDRQDPERSLANSNTKAIHTHICGVMKDFVSPNGRSASLWIAETLWEVCESESAIENANLVTLAAYVEGQGEPLFTDQLQELYRRVLMLVQEASVHLWQGTGSDKKIVSSQFRAWLMGALAQLKGNTPSKSGKNLKRKFNDAAIDQNAAEVADDLRIAYRSKILNTTYQQDESLKAAELEVAAVAQKLLSNLDAGLLSDDGPSFHARCLNELAKIQKKFPAATESFLQGALYSATDRCRHRFVKAQT